MEEISGNDLNRPYHLHWDVTLRDGRLGGVLSAVGRHPSRGLSLAHWVELRKEEDQPEDAPAIIILKDIPYYAGKDANPEEEMWTRKRPPRSGLFGQSG